jgi:hypothetical protein
LGVFLASTTIAFILNFAIMNLSIWSRSAVVAVTLVAAATAPVWAQYNGGNDAGSGREAISVPRKTQITYPPTIQTAVDRFSQSLSADRIGHLPTFEVINGGATDPLAKSLLPAGVANDGATSKAARDLANTLQGMRSTGGKIDAAKLNASVGAYNNYVRVLGTEVGERAPIVAPVAQKAVKGLLSSLLQVANQASAQTPATVPTSTGSPNPKSASSATN